MRAIVIIGDGMADRPIDELGYLTPLETAKPKNMDYLASNGVSGLLNPMSLGMTPGSAAANLAILGYDLNEAHSGRGPYEAAGARIKMKNGEVAFRCNFATVNHELRVVDERAGRIREEIDQMIEDLQNLYLGGSGAVRYTLKQTLGFKGVLVLHGERFSSNVSASMPKVGDKADSVRPLDYSSQAVETARLLNEFIRKSFEVLREHPVNKKREKSGKPPANVVIPWGGGEHVKLKPLSEKYGLQAACVAAASLVKGIAQLVGMTVVNVPEATGEVDTNTLAKAEAALKVLRNHDLVLIHVEGPDEASHDGDIAGKISIIRKIDSMIEMLQKNASLRETCIALLADHATSTKLRRHLEDPAPVTIANAEIAPDGVMHYSERAAAHGRLGCFPSREFMPKLLNMMAGSETVRGLR